MKLEQQVCSLELAKRLKVLGVKQESVFNWCEWIQVPPIRTVQANPRVLYGKNGWTEDALVSAFTVGELCELLPKGLVRGEHYCELTIIRSSVWRVHYGQFNTTPESLYITGGENLADTLAKMLIYLLENKLVTV